LGWAAGNDMSHGTRCSWVAIVAEKTVEAFGGRTVVITGGGSGVGAAIALAFARQGASLCLVGRRLEPLQTVARQARKLGAQAAYYSADLSSHIAQSELVQRLTTDLRHVDVLVQNAAMFAASATELADLEVFDQHYRTNVRAPYALTKALLPLLRARQGELVFINSSSGVRAKALTAQYDATKHALKAIADSLREEVNGDGIRVLSIYLGRTASDMQRHIHEGTGTPYQPHLLLQPEDVASTILCALMLPRTAEVTDIHIRPRITTQRV
jgi:NADP-dependent 3-hydroxy acid dehydrogenase YdfG